MTSIVPPTWQASLDIVIVTTNTKEFDNIAGKKPGQSDNLARGSWHLIVYPRVASIYWLLLRPQQTVSDVPPERGRDDPVVVAQL